jgi:DNA-binding transcriptional regulator YiaG
MATFLDNHPGAKNDEVAAALGVTVSCVSTVRVEIKRTGKRTSSQMDELCERYKTFMKDNPRAKTRIASEALGLTTGLVVYIRRKIGIAPKRSARAREKLKERIAGILKANPELSNRELAAVVNKPKTTVVTIRDELNMSRDADEARDILFISVAQQVRQIVVAEGLELTDEKLAKRVGVSLCTIVRWRKKLGIPSWKKRKYQPDETYFRKMWEDGWSDTEIATVIGCCYQRVQKWRYRNKLIANVIHDSLRRDALCRSHTPTTLIDVVGKQMKTKKLDTVWAFAALGADRGWLKKRFPEVSNEEIKQVTDHLLQWAVPRNLRRIIRRKQLIEHE